MESFAGLEQERISIREVKISKQFVRIEVELFETERSR
jgi:hypothetical protein